eukprot:710801-Pyramimonas_sp.AAC.1
MEELDMGRGRYDGCLFMKLSNLMKEGRRAGDFLVAGPSDEVDKLLEAMGDELKLSDAAELAENGGQATFPSAQVEKVEGGYTVNGKTSMIDDNPEGVGPGERKAISRARDQGRGGDEERRGEAGRGWS